jgi:sugar lactone lactonase YvrE
MNSKERASVTAAVTIAMTMACGAAAAAPQVVATGLANPRGLNFAPNGALYVAEAGSGGPRVAGNCVPSPVQPVDRCYGPTGAVTRIEPDGTKVQVLGGLPSLALPDGTVEGGVTDVAFLGTAAHALLGVGGDPRTIRAALGSKVELLGKLLRVTPSGQMKVIADVAQNEIANNPFGGPVDTNPYSVLSQPGRWIVADAGSNALVEVSADGSLRTFAVPTFPTREPVPTSVAEGPDGAVYAGMLTGAPWFRGSARVQRFESDGSAQGPAALGLTAVVDIAFDAAGALYVLEVATGLNPPTELNPGLGVGRLLRVCPSGARQVLDSGLTFPSGVAIGPDGAVYYTNFGTSTTNGEIRRLAPAACP